MAVYQVKLPACTYAGEKSIEKIREIIKKEKAASVLVFTDKGVEGAGLLEFLVKELEAVQVKYQIADDLKAEPSYQEIEQCLEKINGTDTDLVIALGGGSVMDTAKLFSLLKDAPYTVKELLTDASIAEKRLKSVMIPTTCGTGAEATCNAIVAVPEEQSKKGIVNEAMIPDYVILDACMIRMLPRAVVAATGVDALAHVVECYTSKKATPLSNTYAMAGAKLIFHNILRAYSHPDDMQAKENMMLGAYYGGIAINASGTTAVHALSYPLGGKYHIAHGVSNAILFAQVMEYNRAFCEKELSELCDGVYPEFFEKTQEEKSLHMISEIRNIVEKVQIPTDLNQFGITREDIAFLTEAGSGQTRLLVNNRRELSKEDIRLIYEKVL